MGAICSVSDLSVVIGSEYVTSVWNNRQPTCTDLRKEADLSKNAFLEGMRHIAKRKKVKKKA